MKKLNIQNEQGRSMVEMLGVLAIIGVLSVGGIAGYTTAMRSHRANEIVNACSLLYVVANTKNESGDITYKSAFGSLPTGVSELKYNNGTITAKITDAAVCTEVKNKLGDKVSGECSGTASSLAVKLGDAKEEIDEQYYSKSDSCPKAGTFHYENEQSLSRGPDDPLVNMTKCYTPEVAEQRCAEEGGTYVGNDLGMGEDNPTDTVFCLSES